VGAECHADGRTDECAKLIVAFCNFSNAPKINLHLPENTTFIRKTSRWIPCPKVVSGYCRITGAQSAWIKYRVLGFVPGGTFKPAKH
jgi:hypothetical protein